MCKSQLLETGHLHNFWASNEETGPKIRMYSKNWVGQVRFENFDFLVKVKVHLVKAFFSLTSFFFFFFWGGSDRVRMRVGPGQTRSELSGWWRHGWRHCFGCMWHVWHMRALGAYRMARVRAWALMEARVRCGECSGDAWGRVSGFLDLKFSGFVVLRPYKTPVGSVL